MRRLTLPCALLFALASGAALAQTNVQLTPKGCRPAPIR